MEYAKHVKSVLEQNIDNLFVNKNKSCYNPDRDFTRTRKLGFKEVIKLLIAMEGGTLNSELLKFFDYSPDAALSSAFVQQRHKLKEDAFVDLFNDFNNSFPFDKTFMGYRLIACDGSDFNIYNNPNDSSTYYQTSHALEGFNMMHLDACYDLGSRRYTDVIVNPWKEYNEPGAMVTMMDRYAGPHKTIFIADRGYESYNIFAHAMEDNLKFLIRAKDRNSSGILKGYADELPESDEFDVDIERVFTTRGGTKEHLAYPEKYKIISGGETFDYLKNTEDLYVMGFRVLKFKISDGSYECIITKLPREGFELPTIKRLYGMRLGGLRRYLGS